MKEMIGIGFSAVVLVIFIAVFLISYFGSKGRYDEYLEYVDKEEYGLKDFIPMGLYLIEKDGIGKLYPLTLQTVLARRKNDTYQKILELRGPKDVEFYEYIHSGYRRCVALVVSVAAAIIGLIMNVQGDMETGCLFSVAAAVAFIIVPFLIDESLKEQIEKRRRSIQMEFPEFINKLTLLVNAGMTISKAWEKIIDENKKNHILYNEMQYALMEIRSGKTEAVAYEEFARRCHVKEVTKFVSVIVMNLRRGGAEVVPVLKAQGNECWEMRKNAARQMGEEASTKILIPLMIMFLGIVIIVSTPAVLSMTSGM